MIQLARRQRILRFPRRRPRAFSARFSNRRLTPETRFLAEMLLTFRTRHDVLLRRYERLVRRTDTLESQREAVGHQISALDRAIGALQEYGTRKTTRTVRGSR